MEFSRRRERELERLGDEAQALWSRQRDVLGRAAELLRDAGRTAGDIGRDDLLPRARHGLDAVVGSALKRFGRSVPKSSGPGAGAYVLMGIGAVAVAVIGYAVWNTLRPDDDLWIDVDDDL